MTQAGYGWPSSGYSLKALANSDSSPPAGEDEARAIVSAPPSASKSRNQTVKQIYFSVIANEPSQSDGSDICRSELMRDAKRA